MAVGYVRVSTSEQADSGLGLAAQEAAIRQECGRRDWRLLGMEVDAGISGKALHRSGLDRALELCRSGQASSLVVAKLDRLSRSMQQAVALLAAAQHEGWTLVPLDLGLDLTTPSGEAMAHMLATFAQFERRMIAARTRDAMAVARARGVRIGRPAELPDAVVERITSERLAGRTLQAIADSLNSDRVTTGHGAPLWRPSSVRAVVLRAQAASA